MPSENKRHILWYPMLAKCTAYQPTGFQVNRRAEDGPWRSAGLFQSGGAGSLRDKFFETGVVVLGGNQWQAVICEVDIVTE